MLCVRGRCYCTVLILSSISQSSLWAQSSLRSRLGCPQLYQLVQQLGCTQRNVRDGCLPDEELKGVMTVCTLLNARSARVKGLQWMISLMLAMTQQANLVSKIQSGHWILAYDVDIHRSTRHGTTRWILLKWYIFISIQVLYIHVHVYTHALFSLDIDQVLLIMPTYHTIIPQQQAGLLSKSDVVAVARALCGSLAASWSRCTRLLQLWRRHGEARLRCRVAFAAWLSRPLCEFSTYIS